MRTTRLQPYVLGTLVPCRVGGEWVGACVSSDGHQMSQVGG